MKLKSSLLITSAMMASLQLGVAGDISGKISLKGPPATEKEIALDPGCGKLHGGGNIKTRFYVSQGGGLGDAVVTLKGVMGKSTGASAAPVNIDQKGCEYTPYVSVAQTGQKIHVKNSDPLLHNVHPTPTATGNKESNKAHLPGGADLVYEFPTAEVLLRFKCDVHPWMFAYVNIADHPWSAVSAADGSFKIAGVPDGKYTLEVRHRKAAPLGVVKEIEVKGGAVTADFSLEVK